jgi:hypothetical protein
VVETEDAPPEFAIVDPGEGDAAVEHRVAEPRVPELCEGEINRFKGVATRKIELFLKDIEALQV